MSGDANPRFEQALRFAVEAHCRKNQERKGTDFPYVGHPIRVAEILDRFELDDDVVVAGFVHDTIEDADVPAAEIRATFGTRVAALVEAASEPDKSLDWKPRKEHTLAQLRELTDDGMLALVAADKLDNVRSIADTLRHHGATKTWALFREGRQQQHWYYRSVAEILLGKNAENRLFRTLDYETQTLFPDPRRSTSLFAGKPLGTPHDVRTYLADPIKHWRPCYSALELATSWIGSAGIPHTVQTVLSTSPQFADCRLIEGFFEREVELGTRGLPSQTDLLVLAELSTGYGVIAVEGKARESFGPLVEQWNDGAGKQARLDDLCGRLGLDPAASGPLRYQLLHRTASALIEARRYGARHALMLVHSFDPEHSSFDAYGSFASALGVGGAELNSITTAIERDGIELSLGWVADRP